MEIIGINGVIAGVGGRVSPSRSSTPDPAGTTPRQSSSNTEEARAARRSQETRPSNVSEAVKLEQAVRESVKKLNEFIRPYVTSLQFSVDKELGRVVVKIMDSETKEIIKQIPSEDVLTLTKALSKVAGLIVRQEA